ncbi:MAG TPA: hypothetical protein VMY59_07465 [Candidatus Thermoplasmatota archaeon]|nr:hypothetical protein [Candidatus Thermoplasmatota archaeon]
MENMIPDLFGNATKRPGTVFRTISNGDGTYRDGPVTVVIYDYPQLQDILESYVTDRLDNIFTDIVVVDPQGTTPITNETDLLKIGVDVDYPLDGSYYLTTDIVVSDTKTVALIGDSSNEFSGIFDGRGHKITYTLDDGGQGGENGLFAEIEDGALIQNLLIDANMTIANSSGIFASVILSYGGENPVNIKNVHVTGTVNVVNTWPNGDPAGRESPTGISGFVGGFIGDVGSEINFIDCTSNVDITLVSSSDGFQETGGFAGDGSNNSAANVTTFTNCHYRGTISNTGAANQIYNEHGGFVGKTLGTDFVNCSANVTITDDGVDIGGFIGIDDGLNTFTECFSLGSISAAKAGGGVGGFVGQSYPDSTYTDCYTKCDVTSTGSGTATGGYVGYAYGTFTNCYCIGAVTEVAGGGFAESEWNTTMTSCYWDTETSGQATSAGDAVGKTTTLMKTQATYTDWDFDNVWVMPIL